MTEKIGLEAVLIDSEFQSGVKSYNTGIDSMESSNKDAVKSSEALSTGLEKTDKTMEQSGKSAVELAASMEIVEQAYDQVKQIVGEALELAELGAQSERVEKRFRAFAETLGDADEMLEAFQRGAGGTVDKMTAMNSASRLMQMGLVTSADEMERVVEMATRLGDQTMSAGDRVSDFALMLANQSIPRLDNFGISSGKVRERMAELTTGINALSREQAFSQAVFEQGGVSLGVLGERVDDSAAAFERAQAKMADTRVEIGQKLAPAAATLMSLLAEMESGTIALAAGIGTILGVLVKFSGGLGGLAGKLGASGKQMGALGLAIAGLVVAVEFASDKFKEMNTAQEESKEAARSLGDEVKELVAGGMSLDEAMTVMAGRVREASDEWDNMSNVQKVAVGVLRQGGEYTEAMSEATGSLKDVLVESTTTYSEYTAAVTEFGVKASGTQGDLNDLTAIQQKYDEQLASGAITQEQYAIRTESVTAEIERLGEVAKESAGDMALLTETQFRAAKKIQEVAEATAEGTVLMKAWDDEMVIAANETDTLTRETGKLTDQQIELQQHTRQLAFDQAEATENSAGFSAKLATQQQVVAQSADRAAAAADRQAASALVATAALEEKRRQDIQTAEAEVALAQSMVDVTDAGLAQAFITGLDAEAMGLTAYQAAVENIQLSFGLATPESIALSHGITQGLEAANAGAIAYKDLDQFILALKADAADGSVDFDTLARTFASSQAQAEMMAATMDATGENMGGLSGRAVELVMAEAGLEGVTKQARDQMISFDGAVANVATGTSTWTDSLTGATHSLMDGKGTIEDWQNLMGGLDARMLAVGENLLGTEEKIGAVNATFERGAQPAEDAEASVEGVADAHATARVPVEEFATAVDEIPEGMDAAASAAPPAAQGVIEFGEAAGDAIDPVAHLAANITALSDAMSGMPTMPSLPAGGGGGGGMPHMQEGGQLGGTPSQAIPIMAHGRERFAPEGMVVDPFGPPRAPTSAPAVGAFGRTGSTSTTNITERAGDVITIQVPNMLAADMLASSLRQQRKARAGMG